MGFKTAISQTLRSRVLEHANWDKLVEPDQMAAERLEELAEKNQAPQRLSARGSKDSKSNLGLSCIGIVMKYLKATL